MRYKDGGRVHLDFHRTLNGTICYLSAKYGEAFLKKTFRVMAHDVYRSIHRDLARGEPGQLVDHWRYFFGREGGEFSIEEKEGEILLEVEKCPGANYLKSIDVKISPLFCLQTIELNNALSEGTPFQIETRKRGEGACSQVIRRRSRLSGGAAKSREKTGEATSAAFKARPGVKIGLFCQHPGETGRPGLVVF